MNSDQTALLAHIEALNAETQAFLDANPTAFGGMIHTDIEDWNKDGVYTADDLTRYDLATTIYYSMKEDGLYANWTELFNKTTEELKTIESNL